MFFEYGNTFLYALLILITGIILGRVWAFLRESGIVRRDRSRQTYSFHYIMGLNYLISNKKDLAIKEFTKAAKENAWAPDIYITLGNLYREKGMVQKAIQIHQGILHRSDIPKEERLQAQCCLGLDFKKGGLVDRALATFKDLIKEDPDNIHALMLLGKLYEELRNWDAAYKTLEKIAHTREERLELSFLKNQIGLDFMREGKLREAQKKFQEAMSLNQDFHVARIYLGDIYMKQGKTAEAVAYWEEFASGYQRKAHLVLSRLETGYRLLGDTERLSRFCHKMLETDEQEWRLYCILSRIEAERGNRAEATEFLFRAWELNPTSMEIHRRILKHLMAEASGSDPLKEYVSRLEGFTEGSDSYVCLQCHYKSSEHLWNCPHCHAWDSFQEGE